MDNSGFIHKLLDKKNEKLKERRNISKMDVYRGKKVLLESGTLRPACVMVQNGKILQVHESYQIPQDLEEKR